ncbi:MAG: MlaD family protein [Bacteroidia bacterium]
MKLERETKIGLFTIVALTTLYLGYNFLRGKKFFSDVKEYYVVFNSVEGVVKSTPIYYKGLKVGQVEKFSLLKDDNKNRILGTLSIDGKIKVSKSTSAVIVNMDLLGSKAIKLDIPDLEFLLSEGDTLKGIDEEDFLMPIKDKSERVLMSIDKLLNEVNNILVNGGRQQISSGIDDLSHILHNLKSTSAQLNTFISKESPGINKAIDNFETVAADLKNSSGNLTKTVENVKLITDSLKQAPLKETVESLKIASNQLNTLLSGINKGEGTLGMLAKDSSLYNNLNLSAQNLQSLLNDIETYPARYVNVSVFGSSAKKAEKQREKDKKKKNIQ